MMKRLLIGLAAVVVVACLWWAYAEGPFRDPEEVLRDFYSARNRAEDQLMDPLILKGSGVVPLVLLDVRNKDTKLRRYAIGFLGNGRYRSALPVLESVLADGMELDYFRADAMIAIYQIDPRRAATLAPRYVDRTDQLGDVTRTIQAGGNPVLWRRTWWQALRHAHE